MRRRKALPTTGGSAFVLSRGELSAREARPNSLLRLPRFGAGSPEDECGDVRLLGIPRCLGGAESVTRLLLQTVEDRAMVGHFLEPRSELGAFPGFDARIVQAAGDQEGRVGLAFHDVLIGVHRI